MNDIQQSILESLSLVADASVKKSQSTITIEAEVLQIVDSGIGSYKVEYMGNKFIAYTNNQSVQYPVGSKVYVVVPDGNFSKEKIIIGALAPSGDMYSATADTVSKYLDKSDNLLQIEYDANNMIELCSYRAEYGRQVPIEVGNFNSIIQSYLEQYDTLNFSCKIKTDIPIEQRAKGNYGIILRLYHYTGEFDEEGKALTAPKDYIIDTTNIIGDPYGLSVWTTQKFYITIDKEKFAYGVNPELYVFVKDFYESTDEDIPNDIFISGISLKVVDTMTDSDLNGCFLSIKAEQGEVFLKNDTTSYTILVPELKVNGYNTSVNNYACYWFVEDSEVDELSEYYLARAGRGWRCLNERINTTNENGIQTFQYKTDSYQYKVEKDFVKTSLRYKCVIVYNEQVLSAVIKIKNLDSEIQLSLRTSTGFTKYVKDTGEVHLITKLYYKGVTDSETPPGDIVYYWTRYSKNGTYLGANKEFCNVIYEDKKIIDDNGLQCYETEIAFPVSYIEDLNTINCTVKEIRVEKIAEETKIQTTLIGTESVSLSTSADFEFLLNIVNGDILYKYDADGDSPMVANYDGPESSVVKEVKPLSFNMFKRDGTELTEDEYAFCKVKWTVSKNSMIRVKSATSEDDMNYYIEGNGVETTLNYDIAPLYNSSQIDNTVLLEVEFDNKKIQAAAAIKFLKDGESGTNGTKYAAVITHEGYGYRERDEKGRHRKMQLVYLGGGKNLLSIPKTLNITGSGGNLTAIVNKNGSITFNGKTSSGNTIIELTETGISNHLTNGTYIANGGSCKARLTIIANSVTIATNTEGDTRFTISNNSPNLIRILIPANTTFENETYYFMIRNANITDNSYEPYGGEGWKYFDITNGILSPVDFPSFGIKVYKDGQLINDYNGAVVWSMFDVNETNPCFYVNAVEGASEPTAQLSINEDIKWESGETVFCNIVQARVTVEKEDDIPSATKTGDYLYVYYPIEITYLNLKDYAKNIIPTLDGGFSSVLYASDGTNARYDSTFPFTCSDGLYNNDEGNLYDYKWSTSNNLNLNQVTGNIAKITPINKYDNGNSKNFVRVDLTLSDEKKAELDEKISPLKEKKDEVDSLINFNQDTIFYLQAFIDTYDKKELKYNTLDSWLSASRDFITYRSNMLSSTQMLLELLAEYKKFVAKYENYLLRAGYDYENIVLNCENELYAARKGMFSYGDSPVTFDSEGNENPVNLNNLKELKNNLTPNNTILKELQNLVKRSVYEQFIAYMLQYEHLSLEYNNYRTRYLQIENGETDRPGVPIIDLIAGSTELKKISSPITQYTKFRYAFKTFAEDKNLYKIAYNDDGSIRDQNFVNIIDVLSGSYSSMTTIDGKDFPIYISNGDLQYMLNTIKQIFFKYIEYVRVPNFGEIDLNNPMNLIISSSYLKSLNLQELQKESDNLNTSIQQLEGTIATNDVNNIIHIRPIIMTYNRYEMSAINGWDGNKLYTGSNNEGDYLYAPQMGAGKKNEDGSFTGMVMGLRKKNNNFEVGLFGYNYGLETMFLNSEDGSASFGVPGAGQIIISPGNGTDSSATIYGGNYNEEEGTGLIIDLTKPEIKFGSGNFSVSSEGYLVAKGGGSIAGWKIGEHILTAFSTEEGNVLTLDSLNKSFYAFEHDTLENTEQGFYLGPDGLSIGSTIRILENHMYIGNVKQGVKHWTIAANGTNSFISYGFDKDSASLAPSGPGTNAKDNTVYIGTDGISLGKYFKVANTGVLEVGRLNGKHWRIAANEDNAVTGTNKDSYIFFGDALIPTLCIDSNSIYIGTDGISLGTKFRVVRDGTVTVGNVKGTRHWTITTKASEDDSDAYIAYNTGDFNGCPEIYNDYFNLIEDLKWLDTNSEKYTETIEQANILVEEMTKIYNLNTTDDIIESEKYYGLKEITSSGKKKIGVVSNCVYIGTDGISLGHNKFHVTNKGVLTAKEGHIAGWNFDGNKLFSSSGYMEIKGNGSMKGGTGKKDWKIEKDGDARFGDLTVDDLKANGTGSIAGWKITSTGLKGGQMNISSDGSMDGPGWSITPGGTATFDSFYANSSGRIGGWTISSGYLSSGSLALNASEGYIQAGKILIKSEGSIEGGSTYKWSIDKNGVASFKNMNMTSGHMYWSGGFEVLADGTIIAPAGELGPWTLDDTGLYDEEKNVMIKSDGNFRMKGSTSTLYSGDSGVIIYSSATIDIGGKATEAVFKASNKVTISSNSATTDINGTTVKIGSSVSTTKINGSSVEIGTGGGTVSFLGDAKFSSLKIGETTLDEATLKNLIDKMHDAPAAESTT